MRIRWAMLLALAGCGADPAAPEPEAEAAGEMATANSALPPTADPAILRAQAQGALFGLVEDPINARYARLRKGAAGAVCGEVEAAAASGANAEMRPFIVPPAGQALVSPTPALVFGDPANPFADRYIQWCASVEELERLRPVIRAQLEAAAAKERAALEASSELLNGASASDETLPPASDYELPPGIELPEQTRLPERREEPPKARADDDFRSAVIRPDRPLVQDKEEPRGN